MKQIIPFTKEIVFKNNIASITSISLEHEERVSDNEINGDFNIYGEYKEHNDTTEVLDFKYHIPFTTLIPDNLNADTVKVDIEDFTYDTVEPDVIKVNIDISIEGEEIIRIEEPTIIEELPIIEESPIKEESLTKEVMFRETKETSEIEDNQNNNTLNNIYIKDNNTNIETNLNINSDNTIINETTEEIEPVTINNNNEYITYHIHIVNENETIEDIIKKYDTTLDNIKMYNNITNLNYGDKLIIPDSNE